MHWTGTRRRKPFEYKLSAKRQIIASLKPMLLGNGGQREVVVKKLLVFHEGDQVVLSLISERGTVNIPLRRQQAGQLACALTTSLTQQPATDDDRPAPLKRRRIGTGS